MNVINNNGLEFIDDLSRFDYASNPHGVTHILCLKGSFSFLLDQIKFNITEKDYVILTAGVFPNDFHISEDCRFIAFAFPDSMIDREAIKNNYGVIGQLSLLQNPVIKLQDEDFISCRDDLIKLRDKLRKPHLFKQEVIGALLKAHVLDLFHIHAMSSLEFNEGGRPFDLLRNFVNMLIEGKTKEHRTIEYYACQLCINSHYLTEICRRFTRQPASYWINRFAIRELSYLLADRSLTLDEIAFRMNFSSVSHFSRYVKKLLGMTPKEYRVSFFSKNQI